jgi:hypothetical protein
MATSLSRSRLMTLNPLHLRGRTPVKSRTPGPCSRGCLSPCLIAELFLYMRFTGLWWKTS